MHIPGVVRVAGGRRTAGTLTIDQFGVRWSPDVLSKDDQGFSITPDKIFSADLVVQPCGTLPRSAPQVAMATLEDELRFSIPAEASVEPRAVVGSIRSLMAASFEHADEIQRGEAPPRYRGAEGPQAVLGVSDLSWGENSGSRQLKVELAVPHHPYAWKRRVLLPEDVYQHLLQGFDTLSELSPKDATAAVKELGALLLRNTLTVRAVEELRRVAPGSVILRVDDFLAHLPWGVIYDGASYLFLDLPIAQQISTSELLYGTPREVSRDRRHLLILSNPTLDLSAADVEVERVRASVERAGIFQITELRGEAVTRVAVLSALASGRYELIHYAGHSVFNADHPEASAWRLYDGPLSAVEVQQNAEGLPPLVVYSSSCEAARDANSDRLSHRLRLLGLASAFLSAGVQSYIGSFWPVPDEAAADLAGRFYESLMRGKPIAEALRVAKQLSQKRLESPLLWAGITLFGDPLYTIEPRRARSSARAGGR